MTYDIILENNGSREFFILQGLENVSTTDLYLQFDEVELPVGMPDGEYTYAVFSNNRDDVVYTPKTPILDTLIHTDDGDITLRDINPFTGLLRVGDVQETNIYPDENTNYLYPDQYANLPILKQVEYIHTREMGDNANKYLITSLLPSLNTRGRLKGKFKGYGTGGALVGNRAREIGDWRTFNFGSGGWIWFMDIGLNSLYLEKRLENNTEIDLEFGNCYVELNGDRLTREPVSRTPIQEPIMIEMGVIWFSSLQLWEGDELVFDGVAAKKHNKTYGIWDKVSGSFLTDPELDLVGEENNENEILYYDG